MESAARYISLKVEDNVCESKHSDMSVPSSLSLPGLRERRLGTEPMKKSRHAPQVIVGLNSPNVRSASSTPSRWHPQQDHIPHVHPPTNSGGENDFEVWRPAFAKLDGSLVTLDDGLWHNAP
ncbi:hypothetical protein L3X38_033562 [Prunus dulcis]|uniref:Uncharacterized protein n=1 Tax=Prunus dulcis TaxID=3755 RepID=A0AAD4YX27_PRUDU|nr:hypothetical protein L3X38_033562 [Prunus dulcis]